MRLSIRPCRESSSACIAYFSSLEHCRQCLHLPLCLQINFLAPHLAHKLKKLSRALPEPYLYIIIWRSILRSSGLSICQNKLTLQLMHCNQCHLGMTLLRTTFKEHLYLWFMGKNGSAQPQPALVLDRQLLDQQHHLSPSWQHLGVSHSERMFGGPSWVLGISRSDAHLESNPWWYHMLAAVSSWRLKVDQLGQTRQNPAILLVADGASSFYPIIQHTATCLQMIQQASAGINTL